MDVQLDKFIDSISEWLVNVKEKPILINGNNFEINIIPGPKYNNSSTIELCVFDKSSKKNKTIFIELYYYLAYINNKDKHVEQYDFSSSDESVDRQINRKHYKFFIKYQNEIIDDLKSYFNQELIGA